MDNEIDPGINESEKASNDIEYVKTLIQRLDYVHNIKHDHADARIRALKSVVQHAAAGIRELIVRVEALENSAKPVLFPDKLGSKITYLEQCLANKNQTIRDLNQQLRETKCP